MILSEDQFTYDGKKITSLNTITLIFHILIFFSSYRLKNTSSNRKEIGVYRLYRHNYTMLKKS